MKILKHDSKTPWGLNNMHIVFGRNERGLIDFRNDWEQFYFWQKHKWNWMTFTFLHIEVENDMMIPGYEFEFVLLGLGLRFRWNRDWEKEPTEATKSLKDFSERIDSAFVWKDRKSNAGVEREYQRHVKKLKQFRKENLKEIARVVK